MAIQLGLTIFILQHAVEHRMFTLQIYDGSIDVNHDIAIHMTTRITAAIDMPTIETTVHVGLATGCRTSLRDWCHFLPRCGGDGVKLQLAVAIDIQVIHIAIGILHYVVVAIPVLLPAHGHDLQALEVEYQFIACAGFLVTEDTTIEGCIVEGLCHVCIVAAAHHLIENHDLMLEVDLVFPIIVHATPVAATDQRTDIGAVWYIVGRVTTFPTVKLDGRHQRHGAALHILFKCFGFCQIHGVELRLVTGLVRALHDLQDIIRRLTLHHVLAIITEEHILGNDIRTDLQFHHWLLHGGSQGRAVAADIDGTADSRRVILRSIQAERHLLGIGTELIEGRHG